MVTDETPADEYIASTPLRLNLRANDYTFRKIRETLTDLTTSDNPLVSLLFDHQHEADTRLLPSNDNHWLPSESDTFDDGYVGYDQWFFNPNLNDSQKDAVKCALNSPYVSLIHGPV
jgi:hypothetical protein